MWVEHQARMRSTVSRDNGCATLAWNITILKYNTLLRTHQGTVPDQWWRHQMEAFSALLAICVGNSPVNGEFPTRRPVTRNFDVFFDLHLNTRLNKQWWTWWFETPSHPLWRNCNADLGIHCDSRCSCTCRCGPSAGRVVIHKVMLQRYEFLNFLGCCWFRPDDVIQN